VTPIYPQYTAGVHVYWYLPAARKQGVLEKMPLADYGYVRTVPCKRCNNTMVLLPGKLPMNIH